MELPRKDENGEYYISYSQIDLWNSEKGFNTGLLGKIEYIRKYFLGEKYADSTGFAQFGSECENYICNREDSDKFDDREKSILDTVVPLGNFQKEIKLRFDGFYLKGFIDDISPDFLKIRDYKTASLSSSEKYKKSTYVQLDIYAMAIEQEIGILPTDLEVFVIERKGNGFRGGRNVMSVGEKTWVIPRTTDKERQEDIRNHILNTVKEISNYYKVFKKLNQIH